MDTLQQTAQEQIERIQELVKRLREVSALYPQSGLGNLTREAADVIEWLIER